MSFRLIVLKLHRWLALAAAVPLVLLGLSGAVLTFENELDRTLNPRLWSIEPGGTRLPWQVIVDRVEDAFPRERVMGVSLPEHETHASMLTLASGRLVHCDPHDGTIRGTRRRSDMLITKIQLFHRNLLLGQYGSKAMGISSLVLVFLALSGVLLWWRSKVLTFTLRVTARRFNFDSHSALGMYFLPLWVIVAVTGAMITFENVAQPMLYAATNAGPVKAPALESAPAGQAPPLSVDDVIRIAREALPGAAVTVIGIPPRPSGVFTAYMKFPEDRTPSGRSRVAVDQFSGRVLLVINTRAVPFGVKVWHQHRSWHTGEQFGWTGRILMTVASLVLVLQAYTGFVLWWRGWKSRRNPSGPVQPAP